MLLEIVMFILGYKVDQSVYDAFKSQKVIIYSHTSRIECVILCLFLQLSGNRKNICFPVAQEYMETPILGICLEYFGAVKILKGTGMTSSLITYMKENPNKLLMISPEGSLSAKEWKSGFFYIAKELKIPIHIAGNDFVNHKLICNLNISLTPRSNDEFKDRISELHKMFAESKIYPLYPENSNPTVLMDPKMKPMMIPLNRKIILLIIILIIINIKCHLIFHQLKN